MGEAISALSVEGRMTLWKMEVEAGARGAIIAPDKKVVDYIYGKPQMPVGDLWQQALLQGSQLSSDADPVFVTTAAFTGSAV